ncbi:MAG: UTP--glucose-1-phosphate uridylyltransferase, partial [Candidatus Hydrogenedentota bacterium]
MSSGFEAARDLLHARGQGHLLRYWDRLHDDERGALVRQLDDFDLDTVARLTRQWILNKPAPEVFEQIDPVPVLPIANMNDPSAREAWDAGEEALRAGRVGLVLVAGGQGTRLGFDGPKGAYPIGPITGRTLFEYHSDKIHALQRRYGVTLPWYIMVGDTNADATRSFFEDQGHFGLDRANVFFFQQRMMPCVGDDGNLLLDAPGHIACNPNGHGGSIPAMVENGITKDARERGIDTFSYFQVDNWAAKLADPFFIGYHVLREGQVSSKICRKTSPREPVGVHCVCDGMYQVIEYTELDLYPQLLHSGPDGSLVHFAANTAIHVIDGAFIEDTYARFEGFPWHCSHKKVAFLDESGNLVEPSSPNAYKFETFVFDALRFTTSPPTVLEIERLGEYTPIKQISGDNSVESARRDMNELWGGWLERAGANVPRDASGRVAIDIEICPRFALTEEDFGARSVHSDL